MRRSGDDYFTDDDGERSPDEDSASFFHPFYGFCRSFSANATENESGSGSINSIKITVNISASFPKVLRNVFKAKTNQRLISGCGTF